MEPKKSDYIEYRIEKSSETFEDALLLAKHKRWNSCMNRLYYSSFYLVNALLYLRDIKSDSHSGTKSQLSIHFVRTDKLSKDHGKLFSQLFNWRHETDYSDFVEFDESSVLPIIEKVKSFNDEILKLIKESENSV